MTAGGPRLRGLGTVAQFRPYNHGEFPAPWLAQMLLRVMPDTGDVETGALGRTGGETEEDSGGGRGGL